MTALRLLRGRARSFNPDTRGGLKETIAEKQLFSAVRKQGPVRLNVRGLAFERSGRAHSRILELPGRPRAITAGAGLLNSPWLSDKHNGCVRRYESIHAETPWWFWRRRQDVPGSRRPAPGMLLLRHDQHEDPLCDQILPEGFFSLWHLSEGSGGRKNLKVFSWTWRLIDACCRRYSMQKDFSIDTLNFTDSVLPIWEYTAKYRQHAISTMAETDEQASYRMGNAEKYFQLAPVGPVEIYNNSSENYKPGGIIIRSKNVILKFVTTQRNP